MRAAAMLACIACTTALGDWTPPADATAAKVLGEAQRERMQKRFDDATPKHQWVEAHLGPKEGMHLSNLKEWAKLAAKHPPAKEAYLAFRDARTDDALHGRDVAHAFFDVIIVDDELDQPRHTAEAFRRHADADPDAARTVARRAVPALVEAGDAKLAGTWLQPKPALAEADKTRTSVSRMRASVPIIDFPKLARDLYAIDVGRMVFALNAAGRESEAQDIARSAIEACPEARRVIGAAMEGTPPNDYVPRAERASQRVRLP